MITLQKRPARQREFRGPAPGSFAILAKNPGQRSSDYLIQQMKKEADYRAQCEEEARLMKSIKIRNDWEIGSSNKMMRAATQRRFDSLKTELNNEVESRRDKLRALLREESQTFQEGFENSFETVTDRQAQLRERARKLKEEKALDNQMVAQMKYDQLWRDQCEELRTVLSKRTAYEIKKDNLELIRQKRQQRDLNKKFEDDYFNQLWLEDIQKKEERERRDEDRAIERNNEMMKILDEQKLVVEERRRKEREDHENERQMRLDGLAQKKLENASNYEEKIRQEQQIRDSFNETIRQKLKRINRERQEEIALDTALLERILADSESELNVNSEKKRKLKEESQKYRDYLRMLKLKEQAREKELDELMNEEIKKQWQKRLDQWDREASERRKLFEEVVAIREQQMRDKIARNQEEERINALEREKFAESIQQYQIEEAQKRQKAIEKDQSYRNDLKEQIAYNQAHHDSLERDRLMEQEKMRLEEERFRQRIDATLSEEWIDPHAHPWRKFPELQNMSLGRN